MEKENELAEQLLKYMAKQSDLQVMHKMIVANCEELGIGVAKTMALMSDYIDGVDGWGDLKGGYVFYRLNSKGIAFVGSGAWSGVKKENEEKSQLRLYELELAKEANEIARGAKTESKRSNVIAVISIAVALASFLFSLILFLFR